MQRFIPSLLVASGLAFGLPSIAVLAQTTPQAQQPTDAADEPIFGSQMMTDQERLEYRAQMRGATTNEERARIRDQHHEEMVARARERGIALPDEVPTGRGSSGTGPGGMMGPGGGPGGMGPGGQGPGGMMGPGGQGPGGMGPGGGPEPRGGGR